MFVVLYFLMIRPQMKRQKEQRAMIDAIVKGDEVATTGGLVGRVVGLDEQFLQVELSQGVVVQLQRGAVVRCCQEPEVIRRQNRNWRSKAAPCICVPKVRARS